MSYAGIQTFMEKLKQLINCKDIPSINHHSLIRERPQLQLLYDELHNPIIQTLFNDQHQHLERVNDLKKRFIDAAEEAQYIVDLFVSGVHIRNNGWRSFVSVFNLCLSYFFFVSGVYIIMNNGWRLFMSVFILFLSYFLYASGVHIRNNGWRSFKSVFNLFLSYILFISGVHTWNNGWKSFKSVFNLFLSCFFFVSGVHIRKNDWRAFMSVFNLFSSYFLFVSGVHIMNNGWRLFKSVFILYLSFFLFASGVYIRNNGWRSYKSVFNLSLSYFLFVYGVHTRNNGWKSCKSVFNLFLSYFLYASDVLMMNNGWGLFKSVFILHLSFSLFTSGVHIRNNGWRSSTSVFNPFLSYFFFVSDVFNLFLFKILFVSGVDIIMNNGWRSFKFVYFNRSLNMDDVMRSFKSVKVELMTMRIAMASSPTTETKPSQFVSFTRNSKGSKKVMDEIVVGLDADLELIRDKLVEDQKKLDVVSIVGMGGIGKTTLATKVFNDPFVMYHFHVRVWVTVSQTYDKHNVLMQIMESISGQLQLENASESKLREMVHKNLMGKRYLIVIDDIWHTETWHNVKLFFPHDNNGSRILLTSRLTEVAKHANSDGLIHQLGYLSKQKSWDLLCQKVFSGYECPEWSIEPGIQIVENCHGLPLAVLVVAGVLAKEVLSEKSWVEIAERTGSYIVDDQNRCLEALALSYNHLPLHLRECFLYLGGFPEAHEFDVAKLIWIWVAEGFIQEDGNRSLEDIAEGYLMDLIDRNLVIAHRKKFNGAVQACKLHDLIRELCLKKVKEEQFFLQTILSSQSSNAITPPYKPVRLFFKKDIDYTDFDHTHSRKTRSLLGFRYSRNNVEHLHSFVLLRVLDMGSCHNDSPKGMELLVHLRYLDIWTSSIDFPSSICNLWNLQTLIYNSDIKRIVLPCNISDLVNLRHFHCNHSMILPYIEKPVNLQTISRVELGDGLDKFQKGFPYIKKLKCKIYGDEQYDFKSLTCLEELKVDAMEGRINQITFPATLKTLKLSYLNLQWIIQSLPNLQVLKLDHVTFEGRCWNTDEQEFPQLKFLSFVQLDIEQWEAYSTSFPCLRQLRIWDCRYLKEIPLQIADIPTLELIRIGGRCWSLDDSVTKIQKEQNDLGNYDLKVVFE